MKGLYLDGVEHESEIVARDAVDGEGEAVGHHLAILGHVIDNDGGHGCHLGAESDGEGRNARRVELRTRQ